MEKYREPPWYNEDGKFPWGCLIVGLICLFGLILISFGV
jgi:hypothetical protein